MKPARMRILLIALSFYYSTPQLFSQCMMVPVSLQERVRSSDVVIAGVVTEKESFIDSSTMQVYTVNKITVNAWLKNPRTLSTVYVITDGGVYKNRSTLVYPSLQLQQNTDYVLFLQTAGTKKQCKQLLKKNPNAYQTIPYAGAQGAIIQQQNLFIDAVKKEKMTEADLFNRISLVSKMEAVTPQGKKYTAVAVDPVANRTITITSISPGTTRAGTVTTGDQISIHGNGFGASAGNVYFSNADDAGESVVTTTQPSDIISWSNNKITVKVPSSAGTGPLSINGSAASASSLTIQYAHFNSNSDHFGFATATRQRCYLRNLDGIGGYTFRFNTGFAGNTAAVAAFNRALVSWRCGTAVSFRASGTTSVATAAYDAVNAVYFNPSLPSGTLAVCISNFEAAANASCNQNNTLWWLADIDIEFKDVPAPGFNWAFGPSSASNTEFDFESVALHELGHALGLGHVIAPGNAMHYAPANGAVSRSLGVADIAGGKDKLAYSDDVTCFNPSGSGTEMQPVATGSCVTLPITLGELKAKRLNNGSIQLDWNTIQELNNDGFFIERGETSQHFQRIGFVKGSEFSLLPQSYSFTDNNAGPYGWYYRLIQKDLDNHRVSSSIVFVKGEESKQWKVWSSEDGHTLSLYNKESQNRKVQFLLFSATGQLIFSTSVNSGKAQFSFSHLRRGFYNYRVIDADHTVSGKLVLGQ